MKILLQENTIKKNTGSPKEENITINRKRIQITIKEKTETYKDDYSTIQKL